MFRQNCRKIFLVMIVQLSMLSVFALPAPLQNGKELPFRRQTDTLPFTADSLSGWSSYYSYLNQVDDSVQLELILYRNNTDTSAWSSQTRVGLISPTYSPSVPQVIDYKEGNRMWRIYIYIDGSCLFYLLTGPPPVEQPPVVAIQVRYKK